MTALISSNHENWLCEATLAGADEAPESFEGDLLCTVVPEGITLKDTDLDKALGGVLSTVAGEDFKGKSGSGSAILSTSTKCKAVGIIGAGSQSDLKKSSAWLGVGKAVSERADSTKAASVGVVFVGCDGKVDYSSVLEFVVRGVMTGGYTDLRYKKEGKSSPVKKMVIFGVGEIAAGVIEKAVGVARGTILCKELVNSPANILTPPAMAEEAKAIAAGSEGCMTCTILEKEDCEKLKMGMYLGVTAASDLPPKFIHIVYKPEDASESTPKIGLVGKGLTFDSGGYNIKAGPGCMIELMKFDMGGSGAVLGAAKALSILKPKGVEVHFIIAACENMINGSGMHPGDILTASNGITVEVNNTDAEGRLTLGDALVYAGNQGVTKVIDIATLTGACIIALGDEVGGVFTPSDGMATEISSASEKAGESFWRMPIVDSYKEGLKSNIADMKNTGPRPGGSITAALFLRDFVKEGTEWAHLDIAGPVWNDRKGATGFGVSTLVEWVLAHAA